MFRVSKSSGWLVSAVILAIAISSGSALAQQTVGLFINDTAAYEGYTLFMQNRSTTACLIDNYGREVHRWETSYMPALSVFLLENGELLCTARLVSAGAGYGGLVQKLDWDGSVLWEYQYYDSVRLQHHDIEPMPNGNVLLLAWENKSRAEAIAAGQDSTFLGDSLCPMHLVEVQPTGPTTGDIVWEWHAWDHLIQDHDAAKDNYGVVEDHPELIDLNFPPDHSASDWNHGNSVTYNPDLDQVLVSSRTFSEVWVIDHSTTSAEAASHAGGNSGKGGDLLYRWGNPQAYRAGTVDDQEFIGQHDARWIDPGSPGAGNIMVFNNGLGRPEGNYSTVDVIVPPVDGLGNYTPPAPGEPFGPVAVDWMYIADPPENFYSGSLSGAERLPNGNTLICSGSSGEFFEVTLDGEIVWRYVNPMRPIGPLTQGEAPANNIVFRVVRYAPDYPGLAGRDLTPGAPLELYPVTISGTSHAPLEPSKSDSVVVTSRLSEAVSSLNLHVDTGDGFQTVPMFDDGNHHDGAAGDLTYGVSLPPISALARVSYYLSAETISAEEVLDPPSAPATAYRFEVAGGCCLPPTVGDVDQSGEVDITDISVMVDNQFLTLTPLICADEGDVDFSGVVDITDLSVMIDNQFLTLTPLPPCP